MLVTVRCILERDASSALGWSVLRVSDLLVTGSASNGDLSASSCVWRVLTSPAVTVAFLALLSVLSFLVSCILKLCYLVLPHLELLCLLCMLTGLSLGNTPLYCW